MFFFCKYIEKAIDYFRISFFPRLSCNSQSSLAKQYFLVALNPLLNHDKNNEPILDGSIKLIKDYINYPLNLLVNSVKHTVFRHCLQVINGDPSIKLNSLILMILNILDTLKIINFIYIKKLINQYEIELAQSISDEVEHS